MSHPTSPIQPPATVVRDAQSHWWRPADLPPQAVGGAAKLGASPRDREGACVRLDVRDGFAEVTPGASLGEGWSRWQLEATPGARVVLTQRTSNENAFTMPVVQGKVFTAEGVEDMPPDELFARLQALEQQPHVLQDLGISRNVQSTRAILGMAMVYYDKMRGTLPTVSAAPVTPASRSADLRALEPVDETAPDAPPPLASSTPRPPAVRDGCETCDDTGFLLNNTPCYTCDPLGEVAAALDDARQRFTVALTGAAPTHTSREADRTTPPSVVEAEDAALTLALDETEPPAAPVEHQTAAEENARTLKPGSPVARALAKAAQAAEQVGADAHAMPPSHASSARTTNPEAADPVPQAPHTPDLSVADGETAPAPAATRKPGSHRAPRIPREQATVEAEGPAPFDWDRLGVASADVPSAPPPDFGTATERMPEEPPTQRSSAPQRTAAPKATQNAGSPIPATPITASPMPRTWPELVAMCTDTSPDILNSPTTRLAGLLSVTTPQEQQATGLNMVQAMMQRPGGAAHQHHRLTYIMNDQPELGERLRTASLVVLLDDQQQPRRFAAAPDPATGTMRIIHADENYKLGMVAEPTTARVDAAQRAWTQRTTPPTAPGLHVALDATTAALAADIDRFGTPATRVASDGVPPAGPGLRP